MVVEIEGINNVETYQTILYEVPIRMQTGATRIVECFGLENIATCATLPKKRDYEALCHKFNISSNQVIRPKQIDLLLSQKEAYLMSDEVLKVEGNMKLYGGPLGLVFSGSDGDFKFADHRPCYPTVIREVASHRSVTKVTTKFSRLKTKSDREILEFF